MSNILARIMPDRLLNRLTAGSKLKKFAHANGLVYFGHVGADDEHKPIHGFTVTTNQIDAHYLSGTVQGRELTMVERTVPPKTGPKTRVHTWLIAELAHTVPNGPHILLLSHNHPRDVVEAAFLHADRAQHQQLEHQLDAQFLIYSQSDDAMVMRQHIRPELVAAILAHPEFDYEFEHDRIFVYIRSETAADKASSLMNAALKVAEAYEGPHTEPLATPASAAPQPSLTHPANEKSPA